MGRLPTASPSLTLSPSCVVTFSEGESFIQGTSRCADGSDDRIAPPKLAEAAVIQGIGQMKRIKPVTINVALNQGDEEQELRFSRPWTVPRLTLQLSSAQLTLTNISFLVTVDHFCCEDLVIVLPMLQHLRIDRKTLLEAQFNALDGTECAEVGNPTVGPEGSVGRLMVAHMQQVKAPEYKDGQKYYQKTAQPARHRPYVSY